jgi:LPXTG-motif cell wall-anchored protein
MNVPLPGEDNTVAWLALLGVLIIMAVALLAYFRHRRWL